MRRIRLGIRESHRRFRCTGCRVLRCTECPRGEAGLTRPSRGRPAGVFAIVRAPLMLKVSSLTYMPLRTHTPRQGASADRGAQARLLPGALTRAKDSVGSPRTRRVRAVRLLRRAGCVRQCMPLRGAAVRRGGGAPVLPRPRSSAGRARRCDGLPSAAAELQRRAMRTILSLVAAISLAPSAHAEDVPAASFTLASGVSIVQSAMVPASQQSVRIRRVENGYEVGVTAAMPCQGAVAVPWLSLGASPTLVLRKERRMGFSTKEECTYKLSVAVGRDRLPEKGTLYVVVGQTVVGHAVIP